jgi:alpha-L-rhamnosidase
MIFCGTAAFNMDVSSLYINWLKDVAADQKPGGEVPVVIPDILNPHESMTAATSAGWGDVAVVTPWTIYTLYGDKRVLETQYPSMKAWVEYIRKKAGDSYIWKGGSLYGDWLFYHPIENNYEEFDGHTELDFIATTFYAYSAKILSSTARVLGKTEDEKFYSDLFNKIKEAFMHEYVTPSGRVGTNSQTSYVLALMFDLLPEQLRQNAAQFLVNDIKSRKNHLSTGFLGTAYLCPVLTRFGFTDVAYDLLLQESNPSWLYPVKMGATTIWERWDGQKTDSLFQNTEMNSFNIKVFGVIGEWMYSVSAGIETLEAGYKHILIQPHPSDKLNYAKATFESSYGTISSGWEKKGNKIIIRVRIPSNTIATIVLPADAFIKITESGKSLTGSTDFTNTRIEDKNIKLEAGSGEYVFEIQD